MKTLNETYKATFSNGNTETVSAWNELQAKQYFKRQFCKDSDGEANGITIESLEKVTNHNGSPAPTDWGKELERIADLREKAKEYLFQVAEKYGPLSIIDNSIVIETAAAVQKAIAGGTGK